MAVLFSPKEVRVMAQPDQADAPAVSSEAFAARRGMTVYAAFDRTIEDARNDDLCTVVREVVSDSTVTIVAASKTGEANRGKII